MDFIHTISIESAQRNFPALSERPIMISKGRSPLVGGVVGLLTLFTCAFHIGAGVVDPRFRPGCFHDRRACTHEIFSVERRPVILLTGRSDGTCFDLPSDPSVIFRPRIQHFRELKVETNAAL